MGGRPEVKIFVREGAPVLGYQIEHDFKTRVHRQRYFDADLMPLEARSYGYAPLQAALPESIRQMMTVAAALGRAFRQVRVDFLDAGGPRPCVGELTLCDQNAARRYDPPGFDRVVTQLLFAPRQ